MLARMAIRDWPSDERPREKLLEKGAAALSDAELLAIWLRTGTRGHSAVAFAPTAASVRLDSRSFRPRSKFLAGSSGSRSRSDPPWGATERPAIFSPRS